MAYDKYTTEGVFTDGSVNVLCNKIMNALEQEFDAATVNAGLGLTGTVAKIIQGDPNEAVRVIAYAVDNETIFNYIKDNITSIILTEGITLLSGRILVTTAKAKIEFWLRDSEISLVNSNGIFSELKAEIPAYIL